jgi:hypothetical protein
MSNLIKIRPIGLEMAHADRWTGMTKLILAFRNFANVPTMLPFTRIHIYFIQNFGIPMKMGRYADAILELCRGTHKIESH